MMKTKIILIIILIGFSQLLFAQVKENPDNVIVPNDPNKQKSPEWDVSLSMETGPIVITTAPNPYTDKTEPWDCVAADGKSIVRIDISAPGYVVSYSLKEKDGVITRSGKLDKFTIIKENATVQMSNGKGEIYYHPPKFIPEDKPFKTKTLSQNRALRYYESEIIFTVRPILIPKAEEVRFIVKYCRAPVFLVHGFTGDKSTWELLDRQLEQNGFFTNRENYYATSSTTGRQDIYAQAEYLGKKIREEMLIYEQNNVKFSKVDIVAHSMGGLIARYYTKNYTEYAGDVRKIIMVGTPNHGIYNFMDRRFGEMLAGWNETHQGMAQDVSSDQPIMIKMNQGERNSRNHLNSQIEYGNIYVQNTDGVVQDSSARVNGILEMILTNRKHSPSVPDYYGTTSITTDYSVFSKILGWLNNPIDPANLNMNKWNTSTDVNTLQEVDLSGQGHILKVHMGVIKWKSDLKRLECTANTQAEIIYPDGTTLNLLPNSKVSYNSDLTELVLTKGHIICNVRKQKKGFIFITPTLRVGVRGTSFEIIVDDNGKSDVYLYEGKLEISNMSGTKIINTGETIQANNQNELKKGTFNPENRFNQQIAGNFPGITDFESFAKKTNPLFDNVSTGGKIIKAPKGGFGQNSSSVNGDAGCDIDQMRPYYLQSIGSVGNNPEGQMIAQKINDNNKREQFFFNEDKRKFKEGILPPQISGSYTKKENSNVFNPEYYCQTITLFKPMKVVNVIEGHNGFKLSRNTKLVIDTKNSQEIIGRILQCGSYKIFPHPGSSSRVSVSLILEQVNDQAEVPTTQQPTSPTTPGSTTDPIDQLHPQFQTKIGPVNSKEGQFIAQKIDDQNRREQFWFNEDKKKFKQGIKPTEVYGTQVIKDAASDPDYYCQTVTLFVPMKILAVEWEAMGYRILKDGREIKESWLKKEMIGQILQPGSYKLYPHLKTFKNEAWVRITLTTDN